MIKKNGEERKKIANQENRNQGKMAEIISKNRRIKEIQFT